MDPAGRIERERARPAPRALRARAAGGALTPASPAELNVWEATWCGDGAIVAIVSEGAGEGAWYSAELTLIDPAARSARRLRPSDVQLGWACGSPAGTHVAVIEAVCSDRVIVAGKLLLVDPASGEARSVDTHGVDVTWSAWRDDERLFAIGLRGLEPVALDVRAADATAREIWIGSGSCGSSLYPSGSPSGSGQAFVALVRPGTPHPRSCSWTETARARWPTSATPGRPLAAG